MQGDIRPTRNVRLATYPRVDQVIYRPERPLERRGQYIDIVAPKRVTGNATYARSKAPTAGAYHKEYALLEAQVLEKRTNHAVSTKRWLRKMKRHSRVKRIKHSLKGAGLLYAAASFVFILGMVVTLQGLLVNKQVTEQAKVLAATTGDGGNDSLSESSVAQGSSAVPTEAKPKPNYLDTYKVAANLPRLISIPSQHIKARVLQVDVDKNNELLTPRSIYDTAWYTGSSKPGEFGAAVVDGHYVGPTTAGVFSRLTQLKKDDKVIIERGDGKILTFRVTAIETMATGKFDMMKVLNSVNAAKPGLNLITCGGAYDAKSFKFSDRTVVYTVLDA